MRQRPMEPLEARQLLAGVSLGGDGILNLSGDNGRTNTITITVSGSNYIAKVNSTSKTVSASSIKEIKIFGGDRNDTIDVASGVTKRTRIDGRSGNDRISGGGGADRVYAGYGADTVFGNGGNDSVSGEGGNDSLDGGSGSDWLGGGAGTDSIRNGESGDANTSSSSSSSDSSSNSSVNVSGIDIWDVVGNKKIGTLNSGSTLDLSALPAKISLVAQGSGASVKFALDSNSNYRIENQKPWSISGDTNGKPNAWTVSTGSHTVKVTPYSSANAKGAAGATKTFTLNVIRSNGSGVLPNSSTPSITRLELWNSSTNKFIETLDGGETIDLAVTPKITIVAQGNGGSVKFGLDSNGSYRMENQKPWSISGDYSGDIADWNVAVGNHTVKATPYANSNGGGAAGGTRTVSFKVIRSTTPPPPSSDSGGGGGGIVPRSTSAAAPDANITAVSGTTIHAGQSFTAHAMTSSLKVGTPLTARYVWNFDDSGSSYNVVEGFNASHYFDSPGTYDVKLTVYNEAGKSNTAAIQVKVLDALRKRIYVSASGSDSNDGLSESKPIKTWNKAKSKLADNVEILFRGGDTFDVPSGMNIYRRNVVIGSYGSGKARLRYTGARDFSSMIWLGGGHGETTVKNLIFDSIHTGSSKDGLPQGIGINGTGNTILNNEFRNLGYAVNAFSKPKALLVQGNSAPTQTGLRGYFAWSGGQDHAYYGNKVANVDGHVVRMAEMDRINIAHNDFTNPNEDDGFRGTLTIHTGSYAYVAHNKLTDGWFSVGPLGNADGLGDKGGRFNWSVFENNTVIRSRFIVLHGANHTMFRNNTIKGIDNNWGIEIQGYNSQYGRGVSDVTIVNNTALNKGSAGNFIRVGNDVDGINLVNNLYLAPNLVTGTASAAPVFVADSNLNSFDKITNNVWGKPSILQYAEGGINYVWPSWSNADGYKTPTEWNNYGVVGTDYFDDLPYSESSMTPTGGTNRDVGVVWPGVFTDMKGTVRSNSGSWTVGAVEA